MDFMDYDWARMAEALVKAHLNKVCAAIDAQPFCSQRGKLWPLEEQLHARDQAHLLNSYLTRPSVKPSNLECKGHTDMMQLLLPCSTAPSCMHNSCPRPDGRPGGHILTHVRCMTPASYAAEVHAPTQHVWMFVCTTGNLSNITRVRRCNTIVRHNLCQLHLSIA